MIDPRQRRAFLTKPFAHPVREQLECLLIEIAASDSGLIGRNHDRPAQLGCHKARQLENAGDEFELIDPVNIAVVDIDDAVAIDEQSARRFAGHIGCRQGLGCEAMVARSTKPQMM